MTPEQKQTQKIISDARVALAVHLLTDLNVDERLEVMGHFCSYCGCADRGCQCWNDE